MGELKQDSAHVNVTLVPLGAGLGIPMKSISIPL
jgi:hypothetical protein